jgi:uncharacterized damage-inducible protein DinB
MRSHYVVAVGALLLMFGALPVFAQGNAGPVVSAAKEIMQRQQKNLTAAVEEMPAEKFGFRPTPAQMTFGHLAAHIATSNYFLCSKLGGMQAPKATAGENEAKDKLVGQLEDSFKFCSQAVDKLTAADLSTPVKLWGDRSTTKAGALIDLTNDWADHYAAAAIYLRLSGLLPPTAKAKE